MPQVLIVEDDWPTTQLFQMLLKRGGFEVSIAHNAQEALAMLDNGTKIPDAIILDVMLPGMLGIALCKILRERQIAVPILMMSASQDEESKREGLAAGANEYLTKPLLQHDLVETIRRYLTAAPL